MPSGSLASLELEMGQGAEMMLGLHVDNIMSWQNPGGDVSMSTDALKTLRYYHRVSKVLTNI